MSYKMPKITEAKKLCPRCGSPLMDMGKILRCAMCGYALVLEGEARVTIKYAEPEAKKKVPQIKVFQVVATGIASATTLESSGVYLVSDPAQNTIWLWKGKNARPGDAYNAGTAATKLKTSEKLFSSKLTRVDEGEEPSEFPDITQQAAITKEMVTEAKEAVMAIKPPATGELNIYLINKGELVKLDKPVFTTGDSYLVDGGNNIWVWIGKESSVDEKFTAAHLSTVLDVSRRGKPKITSVDQTMEPVLYRVSSEEYATINDIIYIQVPCTKESLDSEDVFILDDQTNETVYIWIGSTSNVKEKVVAGQISRKFEVERAGVQKEIFVDEGQEPEEFKRILKF
jgi:ribosomal protein S27AE